MNPQRLIRPELRAALKEYYMGRNASNANCALRRVCPSFPTFTWDKKAAVQKIFTVFRKHEQASYAQQIAGTFWFTWKCGVQTTHDENNYWAGKVLARKQTDGSWKAVAKELMF